MENIDYTDYNISKLAESSDFINFVFDYKRTTENNTIGDAMKSFELVNIEEKIQKLIVSSVSREKIIMGLHFTGPGFIMTSSGKDEDATFHKAYGYREICESQFLFPLEWQGPIHKDGETSLSVVVDRSRSIANKVRFAVKYSLAGVAPIYISFDDFHGLCGVDEDTFDDFKSNNQNNVPSRMNNTFPLLYTVNKAIKLTWDEMERGNHRGPHLAPALTPNPIFKITTPTPIFPLKITPTKAPEIAPTKAPVVEPTSNEGIVKQSPSNSSSDLYELQLSPESIPEPVLELTNESAIDSLSQLATESSLESITNPNQDSENGAAPHITSVHTAWWFCLLKYLVIS